MEKWHTSPPAETIRHLFMRRRRAVALNSAPTAPVSRPSSAMLFVNTGRD